MLFSVLMMKIKEILEWEFLHFLLKNKEKTLTSGKKIVKKKPCKI